MAVPTAAPRKLGNDPSTLVSCVELGSVSLHHLGRWETHGGGRLAEGAGTSPRGVSVRRGRHRLDTLRCGREPLSQWLLALAMTTQVPPNKSPVLTGVLGFGSHQSPLVTGLCRPTDSGWQLQPRGGGTRATVTPEGERPCQWKRFVGSAAIGHPALLHTRRPRARAPPLPEPRTARPPTGILLGRWRHTSDPRIPGVS